MLWSFVLHFIRALCPWNKFSQADKVCGSKECLRIAETYKEIMNLEDLPCDNFYGHACGNYKYVTEIPPHLDNYSPYQFRDELVHQKILDHFQTINTKSPKGFQNVKTFYELCMNEDQIRALGYNTLQDELNIIGMNLLPPFHSEAEPGKDFAAIMGKIHRFSVKGSKFLHDVTVKPFATNMKQNAVRFHSVSGITWVDSSLYLANTYTNTGACVVLTLHITLIPIHHVRIFKCFFKISHKVQVVESRREYMFSVIHHLYEYSKFELTEEMKGKIKKRVDDVTLLEVWLSQMREDMKSQPPEDDSSKLNIDPATLTADIKQLLEGGEIQMNFNNYLLALFKEDSKPPGQSQIEERLANNNESSIILSIYPMNEFEETYRIIKLLNPSLFESFIWWSVVESILDEGPAQLYEYYKRYHAELTETYGYRSPTPRKQECWRKLQTYFGNFIGHVLAKTSNGPKKKKQITKMFENIKTSYEESIQRTHWADEETKKAALEKIRTLTILIGYDDSLLKKQTIDREYGQIDIQRGNYYKFLATLFRRTREKELFKIFSANNFHDKPEFNPADYINNTHYLYYYNSIVIPMINIEFPFYDLGLEVLHYGITGYIIAHEVAHAIDKKGCHFDAEGNLRYCLSQESNEAFTKIEQCFIDAWYKFFIKVGEGMVQVSGFASYVENMADWQGYHMAMMAYKKHQDKYGPEPKLTGFEHLSHEKLFSLAYASIHCINPSDDYIIHSASATKHPPTVTRVNGIVRNSRQFPDVWGCPANSPMNPPDKCEIWF